MTQYIRTHIDNDDVEFWSQVSQRFQISRLDTVIDVEWHDELERVVVKTTNGVNGNTFFLTSPDLNFITLRDVLYDFGYASERIELDYSENNWNLDNTLDTPVKYTPLSQFTIYPADAAANAAGTAAGTGGSPAPTEILEPPAEPPVLMRHNANYFC